MAGLAPPLMNALLLDAGDPRSGFAPVWWCVGSDSRVDVTASDDDDADDDDDGDDDDGDDSDTADDAADWTPPTRAEWESLQRRATTAAQEAANRKRLLRGAGLNPRTGRPVTRGDGDDGGTAGAASRVRRPAPTARARNEDGDDGDDRRSGRSNRDALRAELEAETFRPALVDAAIELALTRAGVDERQLARIARFIDRDDLDVEYDPDQRRRIVVGVQEQIDELRDEYPELFAARRGGGRRLAGRDDDRRVTRRGAEDVDGGSTRAVGGRAGRATGTRAAGNRRASADDAPWNERVAREFLGGGSQ